eukprot:360804-Chlamydomonas_euryale.AAC.2
MPQCRAFRQAASSAPFGWRSCFSTAPGQAPPLGRPRCRRLRTTFNNGSEVARRVRCGGREGAGLCGLCVRRRGRTAEIRVTGVAVATVRAAPPPQKKGTSMPEQEAAKKSVAEGSKASAHALCVCVDMCVETEMSRVMR